MYKKILLTTVALVLLTIVVGYLIIDKPLPGGVAGPNAEFLAEKMLKAINHDGWKNTGAIKWTFRAEHNFIWDRERDFVKVDWDNHEVWLNLNTKDGIAFSNGKELNSGETGKMLNDAYAFWANDSFWLNPISKIKDDGTSRSLVKTKDGGDALLVTYHSGGVTPGDSYLWILDENQLPKECKMWVSIIPIGGVSFDWENWQTQSTGFKTALDHQGPIFIQLSNIEAAKTFQELLQKDIFKDKLY